MISATTLTMRYGGKILFEGASLQLLAKQHYGLVGPNGSGKSTLLKILSGDIIPDKGEISVPSLCSIGTLKQDHFLFENEKIRDSVIMGKAKLWENLKRKEKLLTLESFSEEQCHEMAECEKAIDKFQGYSAESHASNLLEGVGIASRLHDSPMSILSGGYKLRVLLAQLLFSEPDVLLLDEPTNHLDIFSIRWLEGYLRNFPGTLLICSHDRLFLNNVCNNIVDLDYGTITAYVGNYDMFEKAKSEAQACKEKALAKQEKRKQDMMDFVERFGAKATKARQAQSRLKAVEKLEAAMEEMHLLPSSRRYPRLCFDICRPSGAIALKVEGVEKSYGTKRVLNHVNFEIERGEKIAFVGPNGIGKSTLLEILTNNIQPDKGTFSWGFAAQYAYFPQDHLREVHGSLSILDWLGQWDSLAPRETLQKILGRSLFSGDEVEKSVAVLSGGEKARLILAKMMLVKHNILIFDEPTNHLDMEAIENLLAALENYQGTILFVSHNRYFVQKLATRVIEMTAEGIADYKCSYDEYISKRNIDHLVASKGLRTTLDAPNIKNQDAGKQLYLEQKKQQRFKEQLEKKVAAAEKKCQEMEIAIKLLNERFCVPDFYQTTSKSAQAHLLDEKNCLDNLLQEALSEWEAASEALQDK